MAQNHVDTLIRENQRRCDLPIVATHGDAEVLGEIDIECAPVDKDSRNCASGLKVIEHELAEQVVSIPGKYEHCGRTGGDIVRCHALGLGVPLLTNLSLALAIFEVLRRCTPSELNVLTWDEFSVGSAMRHEQHTR